MQTTSTALALVMGLGLGLSVLAQDQTGPDTDQDQFVTRQEAAAFDEQRFGEITGGADEMTREQFTSTMTGLENPDEVWEEVDADGDDVVSQQEWTEWRQQRFDEAAGSEDRIGLPEYEAIETGAMVSTGATGTTGGAPGTPEGGLDAMEGAIEQPADGAGTATGDDAEGGTTGTMNGGTTGGETSGGSSN